LEGLDLESLPPNQFVARLMQLAVMAAAERDGEFVAHFHADGPGLGKSDVMRIAGLAATNQAWLPGNEFQVLFVTQPFGLGDGKLALVDPAGD
jgi:hypothetical protein